MKKQIITAFLSLSLMNAVALGEEYTAATPDKNAPELVKRFKQIEPQKYATSKYQGKIARDIADKKHNMRTRMRAGLRAARENPDNINFAGHYMLVSYGCGTSCVAFNVVDVKTGKIYDGMMVTGYPDAVPNNPDGVWVNQDFDYQAESTLFLVQGAVDELGTGSFAFEFKDNQFKLLQHSPVVKLDEE